MLVRIEKAMPVVFDSLPDKELRNRKFGGKKTRGKPVVYLHKKSDRLRGSNNITSRFQLLASSSFLISSAV